MSFHLGAIASHLYNQMDDSSLCCTTTRHAVSTALFRAYHARVLAVACRMNPQVAHNQMEPIATNPFALQPVLSSYTYPLNAWHQLADKDTLRTLSAPPYIKNEVWRATCLR